MAVQLIVAILCIFSSLLFTQQQAARSDKFLMILFDGLRWDYLDFQGLNNFKRFERAGVRAYYMEPDFPSLSFPGYYTILTGLHPENHGFIGNTMYDPDKKKYFATYMQGDSNDPLWWEQAEPLWTAAVRRGRKTHVYLWPGCHVPIHGVLPTYCQPYQAFYDTQRLEENLMDVVNKFARGVADAGFVYTEYTDTYGHHFGPRSAEIKFAMRNLDRILGNLLDRLAFKSLTNKVNIVLVSDHGMALNEYVKMTYVQIADVVNVQLVDKFIDGGTYMGIIPKPGYLNQVYKSLQNNPCFTVWKKDEIPEELHLKRNRRVPQIVLSAKRECYIGQVMNSSKQWPPMYPIPQRPHPEEELRKEGGNHGYLPKEYKSMRAIFLASGPAFSEKGLVPPIYATDVYNLAVHLMGVQGHPNNGTWSHVSDMLKGYSSATSNSSCPSDVGCLLLLGLLLLFAYSSCHY